MTSSQATEAIGTLTRARELAEAAVNDTADAHEAFRLATDLTNAFRLAVGPIAKLRAQAAVRIKDQEALSLRGLADRIGVSSARANQLVNQGKQEAGSHE